MESALTNTSRLILFQIDTERFKFTQINLGQLETLRFSNLSDFFSGFFFFQKKLVKRTDLLKIMYFYKIGLSERVWYKTHKLVVSPIFSILLHICNLNVHLN